jgi:6-phosphogluconolactonase
MKIGLILLLMSTLAGALDSKYLVYVGTYTDSGSKGIYAFRFDANAGSVTPVELVAASDNPSFLVVDPSHRFLYAANEIEMFRGKADGSISVFAIEPKTGKLSAVQQVSSAGWGPVYLSLDKTARHLLVADYGAGSIAVLPVGKDGRLGPHTGFVEHVGAKGNPPRPHSIQTTDDDRFALVPDLALNRVFVYRFDAATGWLKADDADFVSLEQNAGPRHLAIAPSGKFVYLANENTSTVTVFSFDNKSGLLHQQQTVSTLSPNFAAPNTVAEIAFDAKGRFLYVSNRGDDSIVVFSVDSASGKLSYVDRTATGGKTPRTFAIDPAGKWLFAANQGSNTINLFKVNPESGRLTPTSVSVPINAPAHVVFVPVQ